jgi:hypothetical protein
MLGLDLDSSRWSQCFGEMCSGSNSEVPRKMCSRLRHLADGSYVAGMILVSEKIFKHLVSSMPLLVSLLTVRLVLYSNSKYKMNLKLVLSPRKPLQTMRGHLFIPFSPFFKFKPVTHIQKFIRPLIKWSPKPTLGLDCTYNFPLLVNVDNLIKAYV